MRALVTGASTYLGGRLVWQLHALGHDPVVLARDPSDRPSPGDSEPTIVVGDVTDRTSLDTAVGGVEIVFHVAEAREMGPKDPAMLDRVNVDGSRNVFDAAAVAGVPVVHTSSVLAYGPTDTTPQAETFWSEAAPASEYERTKRASHLLAREFQTDGADVRIASIGTLYGPDDPTALGKLMKLVMTVPMPVLPVRDAVLSTVNVDDCADGLIRIAEDGTARNEYILAAENHTMKDLFDAAMTAVDKPAPLAYVPESVLVRASRLVEWGVHAAGGPHELIREVVDSVARSHAYSGAKARRELGWNPRPLDVGLAQLAAAYGRAPSRNAST